MTTLRCSYPAANRGKVVVWGSIAASPFGGMIWQVLHHLAAIRSLGFDVWYVEDSDRPIYEPGSYEYTEDYSSNLRLVHQALGHIGLADRWAIRSPVSDDVWFGSLKHSEMLQLYKDAAVAINLCGAQEVQPSHHRIRCRVYLETDPVSSQVAVAKGNTRLIEELDSYHYLFTYGENLGAPDCRVPMVRYSWHKTRPPVVVDWWTSSHALSPDAALTTVASWSHEVKDTIWNGETWRWSKHFQFERFMDLPRRSSARLRVALGAINSTDLRRLSEHGWETLPAQSLDDFLDYRRFIRESLGEFSPVKEQVMLPRSGWFSDRSVCYLAAGRPVIMQDTGFGKFVPTGEGLFAFAGEDDVVAAIDAVRSDFRRHSAAAAEIAREYFSGDRLMAGILRTVGLL